VIRGTEFAIAVRRGCDPAEPVMLFGAAVMAYPAPLPRKVWGFLLGASTLFGINLLRIVTLYLAGRAHLPWFESLHQEWWPAAYVVAAIALWLVWLRWTQIRRIECHV